jgi:hypothetical protein
MSRVAQKYHGASFDGGKDAFGAEAFLFGKGGKVLVQQAAQGGVFGNEG